MTRYWPLWVGVVGCALGATAGAARAATVLLSDNFNDEKVKWSRTQLDNFVTTYGSVDVMAPGDFGVSTRHGKFLDMDGSTDRAGRLESRQDFQLTPGTYELSFDVAGSRRTFYNNPNSIGIYLADVVSMKVSKKYNEKFATVTLPFTVTQGTHGHLVFQQNGRDFVGMLLDNVSLVQTSAAVTPPDTGGGAPLPPDTGGGTLPGPALPLPAAVWAGAGMLGVAAALVLRESKRSRA